MKKIISFCLAIIMGFMCLSSHALAAEETTVSNEFIAFVDECVLNEENLKIEYQGLDITEETKLEFLKLYNNQNFAELRDWLDNNVYEISYITEDSNPGENSNARAFAVKTFSKRTPRSRTASASGKTATGNWATIMSVDFSYNINTYKIGNIYATKLSLESVYISPDALEASIQNVSTPKGVLNSNGLSFNISATYTITAPSFYFPFPTLNFGTWTDLATVSA